MRVHAVALPLVLSSLRFGSISPALRASRRTLCAAAGNILVDARAPPVPRDADVAAVISHFEMVALLSLRDQAPSTGTAVIRAPASVTLNLGRLRAADLVLTSEGIGIRRPGEDAAGMCISWSEMQKVVQKGKVGAWELFWADTEYEASRVEAFSELTRRQASLLPLSGAVPPTAVLGGFNMHRMKDVHPGQDTDNKLSGFGSALRGRCLDVCTGLGYTAIGMAQRPSVESVVTIELDPGALRLGLKRTAPSPSGRK